MLEILSIFTYVLVSKELYCSLKNFIVSVHLLVEL